MNIQINEEPISTLAEQALISIAYEYDRIFQLTVVASGLAGFALTETELNCRRKKDYDTIDGDYPSSWSERFDVSNWGFIVARYEGRRVGGAVIAFDSPSFELLEKRRDLAVLWDLRVEANFRKQGVGVALFQAVENWAQLRGCLRLKIETQNTNVSACKFYARQGCILGSINRYAYPSLPEEIQMLWYKDLTGVSTIEQT